MTMKHLKALGLVALVLFSLLPSVGSVEGATFDSSTFNWQPTAGHGNLYFNGAFEYDQWNITGNMFYFENFTWGPSGLFIDNIGFSCETIGRNMVVTVIQAGRITYTISGAGTQKLWLPTLGEPSATGGTVAYDAVNDIATITTTGAGSVVLTWGAPAVGYTVNLRRWENGTLLNATYTAHIVWDDGYEEDLTISADATPTTHNSTIYSFTWPLSTGDGSRTIYNPPYVITPTVPYDPDTYIFTIRDYSGVLDEQDGWLEAVKDGVVIESVEVEDTDNTYGLHLENGILVTLRMRFDDGSYYSFGTFMPAGWNLNQVLNIKIYDFTGGLYHVGQLVNVEAYWSGSDIVVIYEELMPSTIYANLTIRYRNGTDVFTDSVAADTTWTYAANTTESYIVLVEGSHTLLEEWSYVKILDATDWDVPAMPAFTFWTLGGISLTNIICLALDSFFLMMFSYKWRSNGMVAAMIIASLLSFIGWAPSGLWSYSLLALGWFMTIGWVVLERRD